MVGCWSCHSGASCATGSPTCCLACGSASGSSPTPSACLSMQLSGGSFSSACRCSYLSLLQVQFYYAQQSMRSSSPVLALGSIWTAWNVCPMLQPPHGQGDGRGWRQFSEANLTSFSRWGTSRLGVLAVPVNDRGGAGAGRRRWQPQLRSHHQQLLDTRVCICDALRCAAPLCMNTQFH